MKRVLVTGGTGFVGRHLVRALLDRGYRVTLASRSQPKQSDAKDVEWTAFDLQSPSSLAPEALEDVDCVFHLAAQVHLMHPSAAQRALFDTLNVTATDSLARQAVTAGVRRFVFLSSIKVNGDCTRGRPFNQRDEPAPMDAYGLSKWRAEQALNAIASSTPLEVVIVRPPLVYGPGVGANFLRLIAFASRGWPLPFASVRNRRSLVSVWNLVDCLIEMADRREASGRAWMVSDNEVVSTPELISLVAAEMKVPMRLWSVPTFLLRLAGKVTHRSNEISRLLDSLEVDASETWEQLAWRPTVSLSEGISRTVSWYASQEKRLR